MVEVSIFIEMLSVVLALRFDESFEGETIAVTINETFEGDKVVITADELLIASFASFIEELVNMLLFCSMDKASLLTGEDT